MKSILKHCFYVKKVGIQKGRKLFEVINLYLLFLNK